MARTWNENNTDVITLSQLEMADEEKYPSKVCMEVFTSPFEEYKSCVRVDQILIVFICVVSILTASDPCIFTGKSFTGRDPRYLKQKIRFCYSNKTYLMNLSVEFLWLYVIL